MELGEALNMFKQGVNDLSFSRALAGANEKVQQIKASTANEQEQRAQLQNVSNGLVGQMAQLGMPATTIQAVNQTIAPKQFSTPEQMYQEGALTGNQGLKDLAEQSQDFKANLENKAEDYKAKAEAKALSADPVRQQAASEKSEQFTTKQFSAFSKDVDKTAASTRSGLGQWAAVQGRGERLNAILGDPSSWSAMTPETLELVKEGVVQMSKGGAMTQEEHRVLSPLLLKVEAAKTASAFTGKPVSLDMSGYAGMYSDIIKREGDASNSAVKDAILTRATGNMRLQDRDPDQFRAVIADRLNRQAGMNVSPDDIIVNRKKGVSLAPSANRDSAKMSMTQPAPQLQTVMVRNKQTGQMIKAIRGADGKLYPAE